MMLRRLSGFVILLLTFFMSGCAKKEANEAILKMNADNIAAAVPANGYGSLQDENIQYFGRWDFSDSTRYNSWWGGAYVRVNFTGTTVKIKTGNISNFYASIDGGPWISYKQTGGVIDLTPAALHSGQHTLSVAQGRDYDYLFAFEGLILDAGAVTSKPDTSSYLIEYIGDSITAGYLDDQANVSDYAWICSEALGTEHTQIAYPGIALVSSPRHGVAMDRQYFKLKTPNHPSSPNWDFSRYTPQAIVLNLGTNDSDYEDTDSVFQAVYFQLLQDIRTRFPQAEIFVMRTFLGIRAIPTEAAVAARIAAGDKQIHYVNTAGWISQNTSDYLADNLHPSEAGHIKVAGLLKAVLAPYVHGTQALPDGTYSIENRNSGLVLDAAGQGTASGTAVQQWTGNNGVNQHWQVSYLGNNRYRIVGVQSGKSLDVTGQSLADAAILQLYDYNGGDNQQWILSAVTNGYYYITGVQSGKVLEIPAQSTAPGVTVAQYRNNGGAHQQWAFKRL
ncbi:RICIN domain-containing protein [Chitinophaga rhizophila]|uniref:RICIN domain-containing protein n=1 Tax=Chitinophaga rhizophila TaxID=2866212 RepID=A0ABS7GI80_9BACT|nr:RICIN domain-containing protein [Chitinophaga rhizophila]MBW8687399.1 RICIN domain-containing protein [Chitinophaga rhizophila]